MFIFWFGLPKLNLSPRVRRHLFPALFATTFAIIVVPVGLSRRAPVDFQGFRLKEATVVQGEKLALVYGYRVNRNCPGEIFLIMYDQTELLRRYEGDLAETTDPPEEGGPDVFAGITKYIGVPLHAAPGTGQLEGYVIFRCNILHELWPVTMRVPKQEFTIIKKPEPLPDPIGSDKLRELLLPSIPKEVEQPPFRSHPLPPGGWNEVPLPQRARRSVRQVRRNKAKVVSKTTFSAAIVELPSQPQPQLQPNPKQEELPHWLKWVIN